MSKSSRRKQHRKVENSAAAADALVNGLLWAVGKLVDGVAWIGRRGKRKNGGSQHDAPDGEN